MKTLTFAIFALFSWLGAAVAQGVPAPGTLYTSPPFDGFPNGYVVGVVLCQDSKHAGKVGLFVGGDTAFVARNAKENAAVLKARVAGRNVLLDALNREAVRGKYVATGQPGRIPMTVTLTGPLFKPCK